MNMQVKDSYLDHVTGGCQNNLSVGKLAATTTSTSAAASTAHVGLSLGGDRFFVERKLEAQPF